MDTFTALPTFNIGTPLRVKTTLRYEKFRGMPQQAPVGCIRAIFVPELFEIFSELFTVSFHDGFDRRGQDRRRALFYLRSVDQTKSCLGPQPLGDELVRDAADKFSNAMIFFVPQQQTDVARRLWGIRGVFF